MHQAVGGERRLPGKGLVDADRRAVAVDQQVLRPADEAERHAGERRVRPPAILAGRALVRRRRLRERRLEAEAARHVDGAEQHLQEVQRPAGVKAVGMGGDAAQRMHGDRPPAHGLVADAAPVGPGDRQLDLLLERHMRELGRDAPDRFGRHAAARRHRVRRPGRVEIALGDQLEDGRARPAIHDVGAGERGPDFAGERIDGPLRGAIPGKLAPVFVAQEEPVIRRARLADHEQRRVRVADEIVEIDAAGSQELVHDGEHEEAVRAGPDADPVVGDGAVAGAARD